MKFEVYGGFEIPTSPKKAHHVNVANKVADPFWAEIKGQKEKLSQACGCYVFALKHGQKITPWYVGKTEKGSFLKACFKPANKVIFNDILVEHPNKTPLLFLIPRLNPQKETFAKLGKNSSIDYLETMLIGYALKQNSDLANIKKIKMFTQVRINGVINSHGKPSKAASGLKSALGLDQ
jgi:competence protein ComGC